MSRFSGVAGDGADQVRLRSRRKCRDESAAAESQDSAPRQAVPKVRRAGSPHVRWPDRGRLRALHRQETSQAAGARLPPGHDRGTRRTERPKHCVDRRAPLPRNGGRCRRGRVCSQPVSGLDRPSAGTTPALAGIDDPMTLRVVRSAIEQAALWQAGGSRNFLKPRTPDEKRLEVAPASNRSNYVLARSRSCSVAFTTTCRASSSRQRLRPGSSGPHLFR